MLLPKLLPVPLLGSGPAAAEERSKCYAGKAPELLDSARRYREKHMPGLLNRSHPCQ